MPILSVALDLNLGLEKDEAPSRAGFSLQQVPLTEVLEVMDEVGLFAALVDVIARRADRLGERPRPAAEHANLGHLANDQKRSVEPNQGESGELG